MLRQFKSSRTPDAWCVCVCVRRAYRYYNNFTNKTRNAKCTHRHAFIPVAYKRIIRTHDEDIIYIYASPDRSMGEVVLVLSICVCDIPDQFGNGNWACVFLEGFTPQPCTFLRGILWVQSAFSVSVFVWMYVRVRVPYHGNRDTCTHAHTYTLTIIHTKSCVFVCCGAAATLETNGGYAIMEWMCVWRKLCPPSMRIVRVFCCLCVSVCGNRVGL